MSTTPNVKLEMINGAPTITTIELQNEAEVPGMDDAAFQEQATKKTTGCPVSRPLTGTDIKLVAKRV